MSLKNPVTPPGIDPGTVWLVAQRLNHYATPGPSLQLISDTFLILNITDRVMIKNVYWYSCTAPFIVVISEWNLNFLDRFSKNNRTKFHENPSSGSCDVPYGRTDERTDRHEVNSCFSQFYEHVYYLLLNVLFHPSWTSNPMLYNSNVYSWRRW